MDWFGNKKRAEIKELREIIIAREETLDSYDTIYSELRVILNLSLGQSTLDAVKMLLKELEECKAKKT